MKGMKILGTGHYLPNQIVTNHDMEKILETSDEWIFKMTGIKERHVLEDGKGTAFLCQEAALKALESAQMKPEEIDMILIGTSTPDMLFPATAFLLQKSLGCRDTIPGFDYEVACSSYVYGLAIAYQFIQTGFCKNILVVAGDVMSRVLDYEDRKTSILFGDGASAVILGAVDKEEDHFKSFDIGGNGYAPPDFLSIPGGGSLEPLTEKNIHDKRMTVKMNGTEVYRLAVNKMVQSLEKICQLAHVGTDAIDYIIPHQANVRIMQSVVKQLNADPDKLINTIAQHANTSGSTIGIALDLSIRNGTIKRGDLLGLTSFGAGLSWGSCLVKY